jgi:hypothetical protein
MKQVNGRSSVARGQSHSSSGLLALPLSDESSNDSDPFPYGTDAVFFSSTRSGGEGGYDLYLTGIDSEEVLSLSEWNPDINTPLDELGAVFYR